MGIIEVESERMSGQHMVTAREQAGVLNLGSLTKEEFKVKLDHLSLSLQRLREIKERVLTPGEDFDAVPGTKKMTLLKPGAEKLCMLMQLAPAFAAQRLVGDGSKASPYVTYIVTCTLHRGDTHGPSVAEGVGSCNSNEKKYRYRRAERSCVSCGAVGTVRPSKYPPKGSPPGTIPGFWCTNCKADYAKDDPRLAGQSLGDVEHPDPLDLDNTLLKMAKKRALVDAVLTATASSGMFTQDMEESVTPEQRDAEKKRLIESIVAIFEDAKVPAPERPAVCERLMGRKVAKLAVLMLADLRVLVDRMEEDDALQNLIASGESADSSDLPF